VFAKIHRPGAARGWACSSAAWSWAPCSPPGTLVTEAGGKLDVVERLALVTVVFLLAIYALVIVTCLKLRGRDEDDRAFRANTPLLIVGLVGNLAILYWVIYDDPSSLWWCAGLLAVGGVLYLAEQLFGSRSRPRPGHASQTPKGDL
jgi:amino acid transporter